MRAAALLFIPALALAADYAAPAIAQPAARKPAGPAILPGGRLLTPEGVQIHTGPGPLALAASPDGATVVTANAGPGRASLTVVERRRDGRRSVRHFPFAARDRWPAHPVGISFHDARSVWTTIDGTIRQIDLRDGEVKASIALDNGGIAAAFAHDRARGLLHVLDTANTRLVTIDIRKRAAIASLPLVGTPHAIALSTSRAYVAATALTVVDLRNPAAPSIERTIPGVAAAALTAGGGYLFAADSVDDAVTVIDEKSLAIAARIDLRVTGLESLRGLQPRGLAFHDATGWLFAAEAGSNAVAVIDTAARRVLGRIPAGWLPSNLLLDRDNIYVASALGNGFGPNAHLPTNSAFVDLPGRGLLSMLPVPSASDLARFTDRVAINNGWNPLPRPLPPPPPRIRHVVLIVPPPYTFDEIFGDATAANGRVLGLPALARFGSRGIADGEGRRLSLHDLPITPNQHALAARFVFADNFYTLPHPLAAALSEARLIHSPAELEPLLDQLPPLLVIHLTAAAGPRLYEATRAAEADLAIGRIVDRISHSKSWPETAIFIAASTAPAGNDHIDAHRAPLLIVSPYAKRNYATHLNVSLPGLHKTIRRILGLPPLRLDDATATPFADVFSADPDFTPFDAIPIDPRLGVAERN